MLPGLIRHLLGLSQIPLVSPPLGGRRGPDSLQVCRCKQASPSMASCWNADCPLPAVPRHSGPSCHRGQRLGFMMWWYRKGQDASSNVVFKGDGTFQISIFNDLHFGENAWDQWGPQQDVNTLKVMDKVLDAEPSDLVVLNGDLITGDNAFLHNGSAYVDRIVAPMVRRGLPWASTYGNHDYQYNLSGGSILARERRFPGAMATDMVRDPRAGTTNYYLPVYGADCDAALTSNHSYVPPGRPGRRCVPELVLWFFDSRGGFLFQKLNETSGERLGHENWVHPSAVSWFRRTSRQLARSFGGAVVPSLAFVHIPVAASLTLQTEHGRNGSSSSSSVDPNRQPGINDDRPLAPQAQGWCPDGRDRAGCDYGGQDVPFMQALVDTPGLVALFSGHDHGNTWCHKWDRLVPGMTVEGNGLNLCFGQHTGYGGYGNWVRGGRQVLVTREMLRTREVDTWIRLETGNVVGSVSLNATYGKDAYPATPNRMTHCPTCDYSKSSSEPAAVSRRSLWHSQPKWLLSAWSRRRAGK
ncbi:hypothetical protein RB597_001154 [Gaeumannomyces tritici]